jgi:hypothetical protein
VEVDYKVSMEVEIGRGGLSRGGASGRALLQQYSLERVNPIQAASKYAFPGRVVKKISVGRPPGRPGLILAKAPPNAALATGATPQTKSLERYLNALNASSIAGKAGLAQGLKNAIKTVENASNSYNPTPGFTIVNGLVYTNWQAHLMSGAGRVRTVTRATAMRRPKQALIASLIG